MSFYPEKIVRTTSYGNGNSISEVFSFQSWGELTMGAFLFFLCIFVLVSPAISALILLFYCIDAHLEPIEYNIFGLIISIYILIDIRNQWVMNFLLNLFFDKKEMQLVVYINGATAIVHLLYAFLGELVFLFALRSKFIFFIYTLVITYVAYLIAKFIFIYNIIKIF